MGASDEEAVRSSCSTWPLHPGSPVSTPNKVCLQHVPGDLRFGSMACCGVREPALGRYLSWFGAFVPGESGRGFLVDGPLYQLLLVRRSINQIRPGVPEHRSHGHGVTRYKTSIVSLTDPEGNEFCVLSARE
jgi:hypothetical protein